MYQESIDATRSLSKSRKTINYSPDGHGVMQQNNSVSLPPKGASPVNKKGKAAAKMNRSQNEHGHNPSLEML